METELITFNEGINNKVAPHLISPSEAQYCANADISNGSLISAKEPNENPSLVFEGNHAVYFKAKDEVVASDEDRFYVEWAGFLYWSNSAGKLKRYNGTTINDLGGHSAPSTVPAVVADGIGVLNGDYLYTLTYLHENLFESAPCDVVPITATDNKTLITFADTPPATATHRILYRSGGFNPTLNMVAKLEITEATYSDNTTDFSVSRREMKTEFNDPPPENLDMLVELRGTLFGAVGNKVYFSKEGMPEYWSNYQYLTLPTEVTGLGVVGDRIIAFTIENMYAIIGTNLVDIAIMKLPTQFGCKHKRTVQNIKGTLIWLAASDEYDLLCAYDGGTVQIVNRTNLKINSVEIGTNIYDDFTTETYNNFEFNTVGSISIGRKYYLFLSGRTVIVDFEDGVKTYYNVETIDGAYEKNNQLIVIEGGKLYDYLPNFAKFRDLSYQTKEAINGEITRDKTYRKITVNGSGNWCIAIKIDNQTKFEFTHADGDTVFLPSGIHGKRISFSISSKGYAKILGISYEYEPKSIGGRTIAAINHHCELSVGDQDGTAFHVAYPLKETCIVCKGI